MESLIPLLFFLFLFLGVMFISIKSYKKQAEALKAVDKSFEYQKKMIKLLEENNNLLKELLEIFKKAKIKKG